MDMTVNSSSVVINSSVQVIKLDGRFDAFEAPQVVKWFEANVNSGASRVVVDLGGVTFLDSAALASLVKGMKRCRELGGDLVLCNMQQAVKIIFELTRLDKAFRIAPDVESANASFTS